MREPIQALIKKLRAESDEINTDGDYCCAVTRRHDADALEALLAAPPATACTSFHHAWQGPPVGEIWEPTADALCVCGCVRWGQRDEPRRSGYKTLRPLAAAPPERAPCPLCSVDDGLVQEWLAKAWAVAKSKGLIVAARPLEAGAAGEVNETTELQ